MSVNGLRTNIILFMLQKFANRKKPRIVSTKIQYIENI